MNDSFWQKLPKPFFALAPMEKVTDSAFRQVIASCAKPDVFFTEFTSSGGIVHAEEKLKNKLDFEKCEEPLIIQLWGNNPEYMQKAAQIVAERGFTGIDINMGCPDKTVVKNGAGSALIKDFNLAGKIIQAAKIGAPNLPVSVKTRIGFETSIVEKWAEYLLSQDISALTIHGRTKLEMSKVPARWDEIGKVVNRRDSMKVSTVIIGNGDILSREQGIKMHELYGVDGIMVGRGIFTNPWFFEKEVKIHTQKENIEKLLLHTKLYEKLWGKGREFEVLKKFYKVYVKDFPNAQDIRMKLMEAVSSDEVREIVSNLSINTSYISTSPTKLERVSS